MVHWLPADVKYYSLLINLAMNGATEPLFRFKYHEDQVDSHKIVKMNWNEIIFFEAEMNLQE